MTKKRFNDVKNYIYDGKNCIGIINDDFTCENIINLLNTLHNENEQLKGEVAHYKLILMSLEEEAKRISSIRSCRDD